jgi:hypothetical protein
VSERHFHPFKGHLGPGRKGRKAEGNPNDPQENPQGSPYRPRTTINPRSAN